jgi:predicted Fe-Mo cluster-binding NifX family protein
MKIAIPTRGDRVDGHFGHCEFYTLYNISEENKVTGKEVISSPQGCGCKSNIVTTLHEKGVSVMLAGNMGEGAYSLISNYGIKVIRGCNGNTDEVVNEYLTGTVSDNQQLCSHHGHGHSEGHSCSH